MPKTDFDLALVCDLEQAANYYEVEIDEIEIKTYYTPFSIELQDSKGSLSLSCQGCNEVIKINIIELPRINNFKSIRFLIQILIVMSIMLLPYIELRVEELALYVFASFGISAFLYDVYTYIIKPPAIAETLFFWHGITSASNIEHQQEDVIYPDHITNR